MKLESLDKLKSKVIETYKKFGDKKALLIRGHNSYTGFEIADEIEKETELGIEMMNSIIQLTIDLLSRDKINVK